MNRRKPLTIVFLLLFFTSSSQQLVLRGDYADPSAIKVGDTYWASATTSNWAPIFPILKSKDLENWVPVTHVFVKPPEWADYYFWAPELSYDNGKVYLYYSAHKKGGNLCLGVASADRPEGPYTDHGPLMCQEAGSIDAFPMRDENGKLYMIWKEDGNSVGKPTPIWAMEMNEERTKLVGEKKELFRNDQPWESNLVEGVSMIRHGGYFYAFYAAAGCCGSGCTYVSGIARSKNLLGPWEKYNRNPILTDGPEWKCPGHGTPVERDGKYFFMYHAYNKESNIYTGREGMLIEFKFTDDGWVEFISNPNARDAAFGFSDYDFRGKKLETNGNWQWSIFQQPDFRLKGGELHLAASPAVGGNVLAHKTVTANYTATAKLHIKKSKASAGLAVIGDENNLAGIYYDQGNLVVKAIRNGKDTIFASSPAPAGKKLFVQVKATNGKDLSFFYGKDKDAMILLNQSPVDGSSFPPWDRAIRVGLVSKGQEGQKAVFDSFQLVNEFE